MTHGGDSCRAGKRWPHFGVIRFLLIPACLVTCFVIGMAIRLVPLHKKQIHSSVRLDRAYHLDLAQMLASGVAWSDPDIKRNHPHGRVTSQFQPAGFHRLLSCFPEVEDGAPRSIFWFIAASGAFIPIGVYLLGVALGIGRFASLLSAFIATALPLCYARSWGYWVRPEVIGSLLTFLALACAVYALRLPRKGLLAILGAFIFSALGMWCWRGAPVGLILALPFAVLFARRSYVLLGLFFGPLLVMILSAGARFRVGSPVEYATVEELKALPPWELLQSSHISLLWLLLFIPVGFICFADGEKRAHRESNSTARRVIYGLCAMLVVALLFVWFGGQRWILWLGPVLALVLGQLCASALRAPSSIRVPAWVLFAALMVFGLRDSVEFAESRVVEPTLPERLAIDYLRANPQPFVAAWPFGYTLVHHSGCASVMDALLEDPKNLEAIRSFRSALNQAQSDGLQAFCRQRDASLVILTPRYRAMLETSPGSPSTLQRMMEGQAVEGFERVLSHPLLKLYDQESP